MVKTKEENYNVTYCLYTCRLPCDTLDRNKVLWFDSPTRYLLIFDIVITHNGDEPLKDYTVHFLACVLSNSEFFQTYTCPFSYTPVSYSPTFLPNNYKSKVLRSQRRCLCVSVLEVHSQLTDHYGMPLHHTPGPYFLTYRHDYKTTRRIR